MPRKSTTSKKPRTPAYCRHKASSGDRAYVELNGQRIYLGRYDAPASHKKYDQLIAEWLSHGRQLPVDPNVATIQEVVDRFGTFAESYYRRPDGSATQEKGKFQHALRELRRLYGDPRAAAFGPRALKAVRLAMVDKGWSRKYLNEHVGRLKHLFKWGVAEELVPQSVFHALQAVDGLKRGRTEAHECEPVRPVPEAGINAIPPRLTRPARALVELQLLTAARSGELVVMRQIDLDTTGKVWLYRPQEHKTAFRGQERTIYVGPKAQAVIRPFLTGRPVNAFCFSPREAELERGNRDAKGQRRKGQSSTPRKTKRRLGDCYTTCTYRKAVEYACKAANVSIWTPHRLRHSAATAIRKVRKSR